MEKKALVAIVGDIHANSTVAVCPPTFTMDDGGTRQASPAQVFINKSWKEFWDEVWKVKKKKRWPLYVILNGELADSNIHHTTQLISRNSADQFRLAIQVLERPVDMADYLIIIRGTEAHTGASGWMDEKLAQDLEAIGPTRHNGEIRSWFHWLGEIGGVRFDIAHHPGTGHMRPWTKGGDANRLAAMLTYRYVEYNHQMERQKMADNKLSVPHIGVRGHNHKPSDSADNHPVRAIILPSWQLSTSYGYRLGGDWLPIGGMFVLCDDGEASIRKFSRMWPVGDYWRSEFDAGK